GGGGGGGAGKGGGWKGGPGGADPGGAAGGDDRAVDAGGAGRGDRRRRRADAADPARVVERRERPARRGAEVDAGHPAAACVEEVDVVAAGAEPDARAAVGADLHAGRRRARAEPELREGLRERGVPRPRRRPGLDEDRGTPRRERRHTAERDGRAEGARVVVHLPAGEVDGGAAEVRHLPPVGAERGGRAAAR